MSRQRTSWVFSLAAVAGTLIACNAILGVGNVTLQKPGGSDGSIDDEGGGGGPDPFNPDGPDGEAPVDKGTIALGFNHGCARVPDGTVKCWGDNGAGELGDGLPYDASTRLDHAVTPQIVPSLKDAIAIAAGLVHTCAIRRTNEVVCWGINSFGQLGNGTQDRSSVPVQVMLTSDTPLNDAVALTGGQSFTCALRKDKTVACWGADYSGQLGDGAKVDSRPKAAPVIGLGGVIALSAARDHVCAILESGKLSCWGGNTYGQLGIGSLDESLQPKELTALVDVSQVAAADQFTCARLKSGKVECWGNNEFGQLGNGSPNTDPNPSPILVPSVGDAVFIWTGFQHACAVRKTGAVACWGEADFGQIGTGSVPSSANNIPTPAAVVGLASPARAVWTGGYQSCALMTDGHAFCWGSNSLGQLGNGSTDGGVAPAPTLLSNFP